MKTKFVSHDWFAYQIISGAGGMVHYSSDPQVMYRQHGANIVGSNRGMLARMRRLGMVIGGRYSRWTSCNLAALRSCEAMLTPDAMAVIDAFQAARSGTLWRRIVSLRRSGVYRQTVYGQISLYAACILGKL